VDYRVCLVIQTLERDLTAHLDIARISSSVGLSSSALRALFKKNLGSNPSGFLKRLRLERARQMLCAGTLSVKEIMTAVGCSDASHFVKDFERAYGLSPVRYRREFPCRLLRADEESDQAPARLHTSPSPVQFSRSL
jgi:transcriptional regulator GlxA family with amidase domain